MTSTSGPASSGAGAPDIHAYSDQLHQKPEDMIGSLLAGVSLSSSYPTDDTPTTAGVDWGSPSLHQGRVTSGGNQTANNSASTFSNGQRILSRKQLLFGTDMNDLQGPSTPIRKESIDLFLSQSPSQTLGEEVFQLQQTLNENKGTMPSNQGIPNWNDHNRAPGSAPNHGGRRKNDSPPNSVTGTSASSRSVSPSLFGVNVERGHNTIHAFPGHSNIEAPRTTGHLVGMGLHGMHMQQQQLQNNVLQQMSHQQLSQGMEQYMQQPSLQQQPPQMTASSPQVLYMAVPTPDGRGQMLQAVQMVQIPGGTQTFVLPAPSQFPQPSDVAAQPMMVLPSSMPQQPTTVSSLDVNQSGQWGSIASQQYSRGNDMTSQYDVDRGVMMDDYLNSPVDYLNPNARLGSTGGVSPTLSGGNGADAIASLYSAAQRPSLDALLGHVRRLSRDQVGCRLLQQALDEEGPMAATLILNEGIAFWGEAMVDPFGNYLFQKILEKITAEERVVLIKSVGPRLVNASLNLHGTRSVQKVVELCAVDEAQWPDTRDPIDGTAAEILTAALCPAAARLCIDSHGNHVIQRVLLKLGHRHSRFVFDAVAASVGDVARHRHGCCVIQRCLDSPPTEARSHLVRRIVQKSLELMQDAYGNYVVQYVLDVCGDDDVHAVCESVAGKVCLLAIQKFSSNVMEKCLERASDRVKDLYLQELSDTERIRELMMDPFGNYVVQRALSVATHAQAIRLVEAMRPHLISPQPGAPHGQRNGGMRNTAGGRRIMAKICRRFPNFTLTAMGSPDDLYSSQNKGQQQQQRKQQQLPSGNIPYHHHQAMSPRHQAPPMQHYGGSPHQQGHNVPHANMNGGMRQPYFDVGQSYYDHSQNGHPNYHPHM